MVHGENHSEFDANGALLKELKRLDPLYDTSFQPYGTGFTYERLQMPDMVLSLLIATREFRNRAISYRGFAVGAGALAMRGSMVGRFLGFNVKLDGTDLVNIHMPKTR